MNPKLLLALLFLDISECSRIQNEHKLSFLRRKGEQTKVTPAPLNTMTKTPNSKPAKRGSMFPCLFGGKKKETAKVAPIFSPTSKIESFDKNKSSKVAPHDFNPIKSTAVVFPDENIFLTKDDGSDKSLNGTLATSTDSNLSDGSNELVIENLNQMKVDRLYADCQQLIENNNSRFFEKTLLRLRPFISDTEILEFLAKVAEKDQIEFVRVLFKTFPSFSAFPSDLFFKVVNKKDPKMLELFLKQGKSDTTRQLRDDYGMRPFEVVAEENFAQGLELMIDYWDDTKIFWLPRALDIAIMHESVDTIKAVIDKLTAEGKPLNLTLKKSSLLKLIVRSLEKKNIDILKLLVTSTSTDFLNDIHKSVVDHSRYNPIRAAIESDYIEGLELMVDHFGVDILKQIDNLGNSAFLLAANYLSSKVTLYIASKCPDQINSVNNEGNNALHLAFSHSFVPIDFLESLADFGIDWDQENSVGQAAIELMIDNENFSEDYITKIYENHIEKSE